jgi:hypothetical protein
MLEVVPKPPSHGPSKAKMILLWSLGALVFLFLAASIALLTLQKRFEPEARKWLLAAIQKRYESGVEIGAFHASLYPVPKASVDDIVIRFHGRTDLPPLAKIRRMTLEATLWGIRQKPVRISKLMLEGLEISIPPKTGQRTDSRAQDIRPSSTPQANFVLERVIADGMVLHLIPRDPKKDPRDFEFEKLTLTSAALDRPMEFHAALGNWKPPGKIETNGNFGPWDASDPGSTPLDGKYIFREADLSVFKGISGTLSSDGEYRGRLDRIECSGTTDTPDFKVSVGKSVDLKTEFQAVVDGTNGDTLLDNVTAHFLKSTLVAHGSVVNIPPHRGKNISMTVDVQKGRVEDFLHLVVNSAQPMMVGGIAFRSTFQLLPGPKDVIDRLDLKGHFNIPSAQFTNLKVQDILGNISRRAEGDPRAEIDDHVASAFSSDFVLKNAQSSFSRLVFDVPGAEIRLSGTYGVHGGEMDFTGQARTDAKLSQMTTGVKSKLLKFVDPFFAKDGAGAVIPIRITGTKNSPRFGLNFHKAKP